MFMKSLTLGFAIALLGICTAQAAEHTKDSLKTVKKNLNSDKAILIDVRELGEWNAGHLADASLIPLSGLKNSKSRKELLKKLPKKKIVYCHCRSGGRVLIATDILAKEGIDIRPLKAGYQDLLGAGFKKAN